MAQRIYWNHHMGVPLPPDTKLIGRGSRFGNPFPVKVYGLDQALRHHIGWLRGQPEAIQEAVKIGWRWPDLNGEALCALIRAEIGTSDVACPGCPDGQRCHGDPVLRVAAGGQP